MKQISLTYMMALRLMLMLKAQTGTRQDTKIKMFRDVYRRIGLTQEQMDEVVRPAGDSHMMLNLQKISQMPPIEIQVTPTEASELSKLINEFSGTLDDLDIWLDALGSMLEKAAAED